MTIFNPFSSYKLFSLAFKTCIIWCTGTCTLCVKELKHFENNSFLDEQQTPISLPLHLRVCRCPPGHPIEWCPLTWVVVRLAQCQDFPEWSSSDSSYIQSVKHRERDRVKYLLLINHKQLHDWLWQEHFYGKISSTHHYIFISYPYYKGNYCKFFQTKATIFLEGLHKIQLYTHFCLCRTKTFMFCNPPVPCWFRTARWTDIRDTTPVWPPGSGTGRRAPGCSGTCYSRIWWRWAGAAPRYCWSPPRWSESAGSGEAV